MTNEDTVRTIIDELEEQYPGEAEKVYAGDDGARYRWVGRALERADVQPLDVTQEIAERAGRQREEPADD